MADNLVTKHLASSANYFPVCSSGVQKTDFSSNKCSSVFDECVFWIRMHFGGFQLYPQESLIRYPNLIQCGVSSFVLTNQPKPWKCSQTPNNVHAQKYSINFNSATLCCSAISEVARSKREGPGSVPPNPNDLFKAWLILRSTERLDRVCSGLTFFLLLKSVYQSLKPLQQTLSHVFTL